MDCIICLIGCLDTESSTKVHCCAQTVHQSCLDKWLRQPISMGRCPHCRHPLIEPLNDVDLSVGGFIDPDEDSEIRYMWQNPRGIIEISSGNGQIDVNIESTERHPIVRICPYYQMETDIPDRFIRDGHIIILSDENGDFFDALNIPTGWLLKVNNMTNMLQLSAYLRLEP